MRTITIPLELMLDTAVTWDIDWRGKSAGETNAGSRQIVYNQFPRWIGKPNLALEGAKIAEWRAIRARAQGRHNVYRIPMIDPLSFDYSLINKKDSEIGFPTEINDNFSTNRGFQYVPFWRVVAEPAGVIDTDNEGYVPVRGDYQIWVDVRSSEAIPKLGGIYSIRDYPFIATEVMKFLDIVNVGDYLQNSPLPIEDAYELLTSRYRLTIEMPLRIDLTTDDVVSNIAFGLFFADTDRTGQAVYGGDQYSQAEINLVEWLR